MTRVTRYYRFSAAHILARPEWTDEKNRTVYGKCANPNGHGHNYVLEVTLRGEVDRQVGRLVAIPQLDAIVWERVLCRLDHRFLNRDVPRFEKQVPTAENIVLFAWEALEGKFAPATLDRIRLVETENNSVEYRGPGAEEAVLRLEEA